MRSTQLHVEQTIRKDLREAQARRKTRLLVVFGLIFVALLFTDSYWPAGGLIRGVLAGFGTWLIAACILGRAWCALYVGGRKARELVTTGPYSVTRNPLYAFSFLGAFGVGLQSSSLVVAMVFVLAAMAIFFPAIVAEERALAKLFGVEFETYKNDVPRLVPRPSRWRDAPTYLIVTRYLYENLQDSLMFLAGLVSILAVGWLQSQRLLPILLHLP